MSTTPNDQIVVAAAGDAAMVACERLWILVFGRRWHHESFVAMMDHWVNLTERSGPVQLMLHWFPEQGLSASQRRLVNEKYYPLLRLEEARRCALITESLIVRGALTALSWVRPWGKQRIKVFPASKLADAWTWLGGCGVPFDTERAVAALNAALERTGQSATLSAPTTLAKRASKRN